VGKSYLKQRIVYYFSLISRASCPSSGRTGEGGMSKGAERRWRREIRIENILGRVGKEKKRTWMFSRREEENLGHTGKAVCRSMLSPSM